MLDKSFLIAALCATCLVGGCHSTPPAPQHPAVTSAEVGTPGGRPTGTAAQMPDKSAGVAKDATPDAAHTTADQQATASANADADQSSSTTNDDASAADAAATPYITWRSLIPKRSWLPSFKRPSLKVPKVHKIVVQQGNVITQAMINRLRPGMTRSQVQFVMGKPVLDDLFDSNRWVYVFSELRPGKPEKHITMTLFFENETLTRLAGDLVPGGKSDIGADEPVPVRSAIIPHNPDEGRKGGGRPAPSRRRGA